MNSRMQIYPGNGSGGGGSRWISYTGAPPLSWGSNGDFYLDGANGNVYTKVGGSWGVPIANMKGNEGIPGSVWYNGAGLPDALEGRETDYYLDNTTGNVWRKGTLLEGWIAAGNILGPGWYSGSGEPLTGVGKAGDYYLNLLNGDVYYKDYAGGGSWGTPVGNISGPAGVDGRTVLYGSVDPTTQGIDGDFYINTSSHTIFGPKATTWPSGTSLVGPTGAAGAAGSAGVGVPAGGTTGQVLSKIDATDYNTQWSVGGGGGVPRWDDPPASPSSYNDEFNSSVLNAKWTVDTSTAAYDVHTTAPSCVAVKTATSLKNFTMHQSFAPAGDFSVLCRLGAPLAASYAYAMIGLGTDYTFAGTGSNGWQFGLQYNGGLRFTVHKRSSGTNTYNVYNVLNTGLLTITFLVQRIGSAWSLYYLPPGVTSFSFVPITASMGFAPTVNYLWFTCGSDGQTQPMIMTCDFVRVNQFMHP